MGEQKKTKHLLKYPLLIIFLILAFLVLHFVFRINTDAEPWALMVLIMLGVMVAYFITRKRGMMQ